MQEHATFVLPEAPSSTVLRGSLASLPADLLEQVRGRVRLMALLMFVAFGYSLVAVATVWVVGRVREQPLPPDLVTAIPFHWFSLLAAILSGLLWWVARGKRLSPERLHALSLAYVIFLCFITACESYWGYYLFKGILPNMTWVPAIVIFFPMMIPGPPRRMLAAAIVAGATDPLSLLMLELLGKVKADAETYRSATESSIIAVVFAYLGARVVYGLGREVAAARELGSYRLEGRLGQGGMGEVWRARHRLLARPAAIKLIRAPGGDRPDLSEAARRRFEREAQAIASLRSPHTVNLFDFGVAEDGSFYYAMELLDGCDADELVRRFGPITTARAVHLLRQVCHSLSEAESRGLVHRDIKPANIFLCHYGEDYDFVKVLDFGLVKTLDAPTEAGPALTREHTVQGTAAFMAPEQVLGQPDIDSRADVYATGCVAYWLLTGQLVFTADTAMALLMHHAHTAPTPPSSRTELPIPPAMEQLVLACLAKDPAARPQSAKELSRLLLEVDGGVWTGNHARDWWTSHHPTQSAAGNESR